MKLHEIPRNTKIRVLENTNAPVGSLQVKEGDVLEFVKIDGIYSICVDGEGNIFHVSAFTEVEIVQ